VTQRWPWFDPADPRAPSMEVWNALSPAERDEVVAQLPSEWQDALPPEGDPHRVPQKQALESLDAFYKKLGRKVYLSSNLGVYYPAEARFAPDLLAVLDVEPHERESWIVAREGKGLDFALEICVRGDRRKDLEKNVEKYARLGIPEYFVFDRGRLRLHGWTLPEPGARAYTPIVPQLGRWPSRALGLDLTLESTRLRFLYGTAPLLDADELMQRANLLLAEVTRQRQEEARQREEEARRAEEQRHRAEEAERRLAAALAELERLKQAQ
jgi:Uma2 family endonuclease